MVTMQRFRVDRFFHTPFSLCAWLYFGHDVLIALLSLVYCVVQQYETMNTAGSYSVP